MDLRNGDITIAELLKYKPAKDYLLSIYPTLMRHPMLHKAHKLRLNTALMFVGDAITNEEREKILSKLREL